MPYKSALHAVIKRMFLIWKCNVYYTTKKDMHFETPTKVKDGCDLLTALNWCHKNIVATGDILSTAATVLHIHIHSLAF